MASVSSPTWAEVLEMDEVTLTAIAIIKGQAYGDKFLFDYEEIGEDGVVSYGIWESTLKERQEKNQGRILPGGIDNTREYLHGRP